MSTGQQWWRDEEERLSKLAEKEIIKDDVKCHFCNINLVDINDEKICHGCKRINGVLKIRSYDNNAIENTLKEYMAKSHNAIEVDDIDYKELIEKCLNTLESKGKDYTLGSEDKLHNFRTVAEFTGLTKEKILSVYLYKQITAVFNYCKTNCQSESEPIEARIMDSINYLLLLYKMVKENKSIKEKTNK